MSCMPAHFAPQKVFVFADDGRLLSVDVAGFAPEGLRPLLAGGLPAKLVESVCAETVPPPRLCSYPTTSAKKSTAASPPRQQTSYLQPTSVTSAI